MDIEDWRSQIDEIDEKLLEMINERARLAMIVGELKRGAGLPMCDPGRERDVIARVCRANAGPLSSDAVTRIFRRVILESRRVETRLLECEATAEAAR